MTKKRILEFIKNQNITIPIFFQKTGIKRGFLDSDKLDQAVSDSHFSMIIAAFPDLSVDWLITGDGPMLRNEQSTKCNDENVSRLITILENTLKEKDSQINRLLSIIENKGLK